MSTQNTGLSRFARWLGEYAATHHTTVADLAVSAGLSASTLLRIAREKNRKPSYGTIVKLSRVTGESQNKLLEMVELPTTDELVYLNPLRPRLLEIFDAMTPSMQASFISVGESMLNNTRKAN